MLLCVTAETHKDLLCRVTTACLVQQVLGPIHDKITSVPSKTNDLYFQMQAFGLILFQEPMADF